MYPFFAALLLGAATDCSSKSSTQGTTADCPVDDQFNALSETDRKTFEYHSMEIVDSAVVGGGTTLPTTRGLNSANGPWSFRNTISQIVPSGVDPGLALYQMFYTYVNPQTVNDVYTTTPRTGVIAKILCPWMQRTPSNQCDAVCDNCTGHELDLQYAPFRLIGIVYRPDLAESQPGTPAGEGRLVFGGFTGTDPNLGPGDDPAAVPLNQTIIFEYRLPVSSGRTRQSWAQAFHDLSKDSAFDETYMAALQALTDQFTLRDADPDSPLGAPIAQIRVNEREFSWDWELREFHRSQDGLDLATTANTPDLTLNNSSQLADFVNSNVDAINARKMQVPELLLGGRANEFVLWQVPNVTPALLQQFALQTCNGCHGSGAMNPVVDTNFHVSPRRDGPSKLSPFLAGGGDDELASREHAMARAICGQ